MASNKIINDPIYGFIKIPSERIFRLIEHPFFQRLRRIRQLGMTHLVYPGAQHTRFQHALGAMHLMGEAIDALKSKGHAISDEEAEAVRIAILLHDVGHGPFSHALEYSIASGITHEELSELIMDRLNHDFNGALSLAIKIFKNEYPKRFLHQLVSSQLDVDRLDYLNRDSFYAGVSEGIISSDRIIKMLEIHNDELVIEAKGIYSIEKFIVARRLMYWEVYLHKTVVSAECLLINILKRAKDLMQEGKQLMASPALIKFLSGNYTKSDFLSDPSLLDTFTELDDSDVSAGIKLWSKHNDSILNLLCQGMINRKLFKIIIQNTPFDKSVIDERKEEVKRNFNLKDNELDYFIYKGTLLNNAYNIKSDSIKIIFKDGSIKDIAEAADTLNIKALSAPVEKYYLCFPKLK